MSLGSQARGIISLRQAEREMLYSFVEPASAESPLRALAQRRAAPLPLFLEGLDHLTWIGVPRGTLVDIDNGVALAGGDRG